MDKIVMKNVKLQPIGCFTANVVDDKTNSSRYKILEKHIGAYGFHRMVTYHINEGITE